MHVKLIISSINLFLSYSLVKKKKRKNVGTFSIQADRYYGIHQKLPFKYFHVNALTKKMMLQHFSVSSNFSKYFFFF